MNKATKASKGIGYVSFEKASDAAKALEECDKSKFVLFFYHMKAINDEKYILKRFKVIFLSFFFVQNEEKIL